MIEEPQRSHEFDEFRVDVLKRQLTRGGEVVPLYSKAFDLLLVLLQNRGRDVAKEELFEAVWPDQTRANFRFGIRWWSDGKSITYRDWGAGIWRQSIDGGAPALKVCPTKRFMPTVGRATGSYLFSRAE